MTDLHRSKARREFLAGAALACLGWALPSRAQAPARPLQVGLLSNYRPFGFINEQGQPDGFDLALMQAISRTLKLPMVMHTGVMSTLDDKLASGEIDLIANQILASADNRRRYAFVRTLAHNRIVCVQHENDRRDFLSLDDLVGQKLGVMAQTDVHQQATQALGRWAVAYTQIEHALSDLAAHKIDAVLEEVLIAEYFIERDRLPLKVGAPFSPVLAAGFVVHKNNLALAQVLRQGLGQTLREGVFSQISIRWFGRDISQVNVSV
ncbi:MAG: transporter substrate-binding domain-containing protein [Limnohabitans sp.]